MPRINNSKVFLKGYAYIFQNTRHYLFYCSIYQLECFILKITIKPQKSSCKCGESRAAGFIPHTDKLFVSLNTVLIERNVFKMTSVMELEVQYMTAESLATAQRMNLNTVGMFFFFLTCWRK